jgi:hypothetical protein
LAVDGAMKFGRAAVGASRERLLDAQPGLDPWPGVRRVAVFASPDSGHAVDIGPTFDRAVASLEAHAAYLTGLGGSTATEILDGVAGGAAQHLPGATLAASFELIAT